MSIPPNKPRRRKRPRRDYEEDTAPPPPPDDGERWSGKKLLLVLAGVFGVPLLLLWIFVGTGAFKALGYFSLGIVVITLSLIRARLRYWWLFDDD